MHILSRTKPLVLFLGFGMQSVILFIIFFHSQGFYYINTPIITQSDAEGQEKFRVTTLPEGERFFIDFFGKTLLTVSGHLAELASLGLSVYTFGPTFRAENSNTSRHLVEF